MRAITLSMTLLTFCIFLTGCSHELYKVSNKESPYQSTELNVNDNVTIEARYQDAQIITTLTNHTPYTMVYGQIFTFEKYKDGKWYVMNPTKDIAFEAIGYLLKPYNTRTIKATVGTLPNGKYRIIKKVFRDQPSDDSKDYYISGSFTVKN